MLRASLLAWTAGFVLGESGPPLEAVLPAVLYAGAMQLALRELVRRRDVVRAGLVGLASGVGFGASALRWIAPAVAGFSPQYAWLSWPATVAAILLHALAPAFGAALYVAVARGREDAGSCAISFGVAFSATPMLFPFRPMAMAMPFLPLGAWLGVGGATLGDVLLSLPACALIEAQGRRDAGLAVRALAIAIVTMGLGATELARVESARASGPEVRIGILQSSVAIAEGRDRTRRALRLERLRARTRALAESGVEAVFWPESSYPFAIDRASLAEPASPRDVGARAVHATVVVGAGTTAGPCEQWNSVVAFDAEGRLAGIVDKARRMPFADASPSRLLFRPSANVCGELAEARSAALLPGTGGAGALICYDEVEAWVARDRVTRGASYLVGFTNDAWYAGTRQPALHERVARMRAIEAGRDMVRVVNGGPSSLVAASGRVLLRIDEGREEARVLVVRRLDDRTLASMVGSGVDWVLLLALFAPAIQRRRTSSSGGGR